MKPSRCFGRFGLFAPPLLIILSAVLFSTAYGIDPECTIAGRVVSIEGDRPLAGALVYLDRTAYFTRTDSTGRFIIRSSAVGPNLVIVRAPGYVPAVFSVTCSPETPVELEARLERYVPPQPPPGSSRWACRLRGSLSYYRMEDYNRVFGGYRYFAPTERYEDIKGTPLHLGPGLELEGMVALSDRWHLGFGTGFLRAANSFRTDAGFVGPFLHEYRQSFKVMALPLFATVYYNKRVDPYRWYVGLGIGYYRVHVRIEENDTFRESGTIRSVAGMGSGGAGLHHVYGVEYFLGRKLAVAAEIKVRLAAVSGFKGTRTVSSARGEFKENVGLYVYDLHEEPGGENGEVMVVLPSDGLYLEGGRPKNAAVGFSGAQLVLGINFYL